MAAATPPGRGGVAIVRVSGPAVPAMLTGLLGESEAARLVARPRSALAASFRDAEAMPIDRGLALYFPAPHSYTGEPVLELHAHGGPIIVEALIGRVLQLGGYRAGPGEFTQRAYLNGKLDLAQAEAVASLIDAASMAAARAAMRSLEGDFSRSVQGLSEQLGTLRAWVEAGIDFAEEELELLADEGLRERLRQIAAQLDALRRAAGRGRALTEGMTVVIAGRPNVGKSTLLNRLAGHEAAIVTAVPGTTRDLLRERLVLDGLPLQLVDTAGLRDLCDPSGDAVEIEGMRRAQAAMRRAERILFVIDAAADPRASAYQTERAGLPPDVPVTLVFNKIDLLEPHGAEGGAGDSGLDRAGVCDAAQARTAELRLSALSGHGIDGLVAHLKECAGLDAAASDSGGVIAARARHLEALARVAGYITQADELLAQAGASELIAEELRAAQHALGEIVGEESSEELLGRIFATFCIGK